MYRWILAAVTIACVSLYSYLKKKYDYFKNLKVPYVPPTFVLGNMGPVLFRRKHMGQFIQDVYNSHPEAKYLGIFNFFNPTFVIRDLELIKSATIKNFDYFTDHKSFADESVDRLFGKNIFNLNGEKWRQTRNVLTPTLTSSKLKTMFELMVDCTKNCVDYLEDRAGDDAVVVVDTKDLFTKHANDIIATTTFGLSLNSLKDPTNEFYVLGNATAKVTTAFVVKFTLYKAFPRLMKLLNIKFVSDKVAEFFQSIIRTNVNMRDERGLARPDMLQLMMNARDKGNSSIKMDIEEITVNAFSFYFGGLETTSTQMCIIAHELAINQDVQQKLQEEIDRVLEETNGQPTYEAVNAMPYLDAVFNESMRRHTQAAMVDRVCTKAFELPPALPGGKPVMIQPGTNIMIPIAAIHQDPNYYENPEKFDPERYYQKKVTVNDVLNMGFGIGPRSCIGNRLAILETKILFFYLLAKFRLEPRERTCNRFNYSFKHFAITPEDGYYVKVVARTSKTS